MKMNQKHKVMMRKKMNIHYKKKDKTWKYVVKMSQIRAKAISILIKNHHVEFDKLRKNLLNKFISKKY